MNPEIKTRWVAALRSGDYEQGRKFLNADGKYCCLGVLCELAVLDEVIESRDAIGIDAMVEYGGSVALLPQKVIQWAGLHSDAPSTSGGFSLTLMNDRGESFEAIADVIEAGL